MPTPMQAAIMGGGAQSAYVDMWFSAGAYRVGGATVGTLGLVPGFTFTRASLATMFGPTGYLTYGPNNLCLNSQDFSQAPWGAQVGGTGGAVTKTANYAAAPDGTMTASRLQCSLGGGTTTADQSFVSDGAAPLTALAIWSVWLKTNDASSKTVYARCGNSEAQWSVTGTWTRFFIVRSSVDAGTSTGVGLRGGQSPACSDTVDLLAWGGQCEAVTYATTPSTYYPTTTAAYYGPRLVYDPVTLASLGILVEEARTNVVLWNRDLTNAAWTATNITPVKDQTGIDGVANSASKITATAGNGTILQAITLASSARQQSAYVKRVTGTGVVEMTTDNGTTWTAVTVTGAWTRVTIPVQTLANPTVGFRIVTSGDAIAVDFVQNETGTGASSAIATTTAAVTRAADVPVLAGLAVTPSFTVVVSGRPAFDNGVNPRLFSVNDGTASNVSEMYGAGANIYSRVVVGGVNQGDPLAGAGYAVNTPLTAALRTAVNDRMGAVNGVLGTADTSDLAMPATTVLSIGVRQSTVDQWNGTISRIRIYNRAFSDAQLQAITS